MKPGPECLGGGQTQIQIRIQVQVHIFYLTRQVHVITIV